MSDMEAESLLFDVFGRMMQTKRTDGRWQLVLFGAEGKNGPCTDVSVPSHLSAEDVLTFLDDLYHEFASPPIRPCADVDPASRRHERSRVTGRAFRTLTRLHFPCLWASNDAQSNSSAPFFAIDPPPPA
jgi:hypothetical protein